MSFHCGSCGAVLEPRVSDVAQTLGWRYVFCNRHQVFDWGTRDCAWFAWCDAQK